jgi:hypothetical protein
MKDLCQCLPEASGTINRKAALIIIANNSCPGVKQRLSYFCKMCIGNNVTSFISLPLRGERNCGVPKTKLLSHSGAYSSHD